MKLILLVTLFATLLRLYLFLDLGSYCCGSDEGLYNFAALNLVSHNKFVITKADEPRIWKDEIYGIKPPLYPFFLALVYKVFGPNFEMAKIVQILLSALTGFLVYLIGKEIVSKKIGIVALIIYSFYLETAYLSVLLLSENIYWLLSALYIYLLIRMRVASSNFGVLLGIITGMLILINPPSLTLVIPVIIWYLWKNFNFRTIANTVAMLVFCFLTVLPWNIRNYQIYGQPVFIYTDGGINMWMGNYGGSGGTYGVPKPNNPNQTPVLKTTGVAQEIERDNFYYSKSREFILNNPLQATDLFFQKIIGTFSLYRRGAAVYAINHNPANFLRPPVKSFDALLELIISYQYALIIIFFGFGLYYFYNKKRLSAPLVLVVILIFCQLVSIGMTHYEFRYIMKLYPLIIPLAAVGVCIIQEIWVSIKLKNQLK
ncbi:MAG: glycosyltransferase family 39 protein [Candidatus Daviesbacteria bacterium]|nr:glycosyltransferase family 39 protein [Candidatus Daviesbacteria bacterium]